MLVSIIYTIALVAAAIGLAVVMNFVKDDKTKLNLDFSSLDTIKSKINSAIVYLINIALIVFSFLIGNWYIGSVFLITIAVTTTYFFYNDKVKVKTAILTLSKVEETAANE